MYHQLAVRLCEYFYKKSGKENYNLNIAIYGCELLISSGVTVLLLLTMAGAMNHFIDTIIFLLFYCPLRQYSGGYHASNYRNCTLCFCIIYFGILCIPDNISISFLLIISGIASVILYILAPVEDQNKPLSEKEEIYLKRKSKSTLLIEVIVILIIVIIMKEEANRFPMYGILCVSNLLWIGYIKNKILLKKMK